jgi:hypothetical protein
MWWYGSGWWWWWVAFLLIFFLLPLGYGWGYRGWVPWYRRRGSRGLRQEVPPTEMRGGPADEDLDTGWGWGGMVLWVVLIVALIWFIAALGWGGGGTGG